MRQLAFVSLFVAIGGSARAQVWSAQFSANGLPRFAAASDNAAPGSPLVVSRTSEAQLEVPLDQHWFGLDCNFWPSLASASLVLNVAGQSGCERGCRLEAALGDDSVDQAVVTAATTQVRFDVSAPVSSVRAGSAPLAFTIRLLGGQGEVHLESLQTGTPRIEVTNRPIDDLVPPEVTRRSLRLSADVTLSYLEAGDPDDENVFVMVHGMPAYSHLFRNALRALGRHGHAIAVDWAGVGYSSPLTSAQFGQNGDASLQVDSELGAMAPQTHSFFEAQSNYLALLVQRLGLVAHGRKIIFVIHEVGGLGGFRFVTTHHDWIKGVAFADTWIDVCPDALQALGYCNHETLAPAPYFGAWAFCVYPDFGCACTQFVQPSFISPTLIQQILVRPSTQTLQDQYVAPYGGSGASCDQILGLVAFPWNITVPTETLGVPEPARALATKQVYDGYIADLKQWDVPKLMLVGAPPPSAPGDRGDFLGLVDGSQIDYARANYPNLTASCVGFGGHFSPEDTPWNYSARVLEWARHEQLLR
jgi:pimeloyl-ACP methyl ester carboxylesterase